MRAPLDRGKLRRMEQDIEKMLVEEDQTQGLPEEIVNKIKAYQGEVMYLNAKTEVSGLNLHGFMKPKSKIENKKEPLYPMKFSFEKNGTVKVIDEREMANQAIEQVIEERRNSSLSMY